MYVSERNRAMARSKGKIIFYYFVTIIRYYTIHAEIANVESRLGLVLNVYWKPNANTLKSFKIYITIFKKKER